MSGRAPEPRPELAETSPDRAVAPPPSTSPGFRVGLAAILLLAAGLRFTALDWGLRHVPEPDERVFVENAAFMATHRSLDHRYYEYPGLLFDLLAPVLAVAGAGEPPDRAAYFVARNVIAGFSLLTVGALALFARSLLGPAGTLAAALFLAVSPVEVEVADMVRPDVVLEGFAVLAFFAFRHVSRRPRGDLFAGAALGAATAVKFSGVLLLPAYLLQRLIAPGPRMKGLLLAGAASLLVFFLLTPYALLHAGGFVAEGVRVQLAYHYLDRAKAQTPYLTMLAVYLQVLARAFGPVALLALLALPLVRRSWRAWAPLVAFPVTLVLAFATSGFRRERFLVPCLWVLALLAGAAIDQAARYGKAAAAALAIAFALPLLAASLERVQERSRPGTRDLVASWIDAHLKENARILNLVPGLGLDGQRFEIVETRGPARLDRYLARNVDFVIADARHLPAVQDLPVAFVAEPGAGLGPRLAVYRVPDERRPRYHPVSIASARLAASENQPELEQLRDGRLDTGWTTPGPQAPGAFVEVELPRPLRLGRVELELGSRVQRFGRRLAVFVRPDGAWRQVTSASSRAPVPDERDSERTPSQVLVFEPVCASGIRVVLQGRSAHRWSIAELHLDSVVETPELACPDPAP